MGRGVDLRGVFWEEAGDVAVVGEYYFYVAVMVPWGVVAVHFPGEKVEGEIDAIGMWAWRLRPEVMARVRRCIINL